MSKDGEPGGGREEGGVGGPLVLKQRQGHLIKCKTHLS